MEEPKPLAVSKLRRAFLLLGFIFSCLLTSTLTLGALLTGSQGDLLFYVLLPIMIPATILFLIMYVFTYVKFSYTHDMVMKQVNGFWHDIYGNVHTRDDINWVRKDMAKKWHEDKFEEDYKGYSHEVLSRINQILNELDSEVRATGSVDWSNKDWELHIS